MTTTAFKNYAPATDNVEAIREQAALLVENSIWFGSRNQTQIDTFVEGFVEAYVAGDEDNYYTYRNLHDATEAELLSEVYQIGKARASYFLRSLNNEWATSSRSYYGDNETPFENYRPLHNPIEVGQEITIPAGTPYNTTAKERRSITKRAVKAHVHHSSQGYVDGSVHKRFYSAPQITYADSRGYWQDVAITPEILELNNLPVYEKEISGIVEMKPHHFLSIIK